MSWSWLVVRFSEERYLQTGDGTLGRYFACHFEFSFELSQSVVALDSQREAEVKGHRFKSDSLVNTGVLTSRAAIRSLLTF